MKRKITAILLAITTLALLAGCGGGGGGFGSGSGTGGVGNLTGAVTDVNGDAVADATVSSSGQSTKSLSNGTYSLSGVPDGYVYIQASAPVHGLTYTGETWTDLVAGQNNHSVDIMVSDSRYQGSLQGYVEDDQGNVFIGAKVFIQGPYGSAMAVTDHNGYYKLNRLPGNTSFNVTASFAGYVNQTMTTTINTGQTSELDFTLTPGNATGPIAPPTNVSAESWTVSSYITRSLSPYKGMYDWVRNYYLKKRGLSLASQAKSIQLVHPVKSTPAGSLVEIDLFWTPRAETNLLGYLIKRGTSSSNLSTEAVLRDPLASAFFDADPALTPNYVYYYTVSSLDTVEFPNNGTVGAPSSVVAADPLDPMSGLSPSQSAFVSGNPYFQWSPVNGATSYQVYIWNSFPSLQSSSDPNGVTPIWGPNDANSQTGSGQTSLTYSGPTLQSGATYYWMVIATDGQGNYSASQIAKFTEQ